MASKRSHATRDTRGIGPLVGEDGLAQLVEHWTANLATRVRPPVVEEPVHFSMSRWSLIRLGCQCVTVGTLASDVAL